MNLHLRMSAKKKKNHTVILKGLKKITSQPETFTNLWLIHLSYFFIDLHFPFVRHTLD